MTMFAKPKSKSWVCQFLATRNRTEDPKKRVRSAPKPKLNVPKFSNL